MLNELKEEILERVRSRPGASAYHLFNKSVVLSTLFGSVLQDLVAEGLLRDDAVVNRDGRVLRHQFNLPDAEPVAKRASPAQYLNSPEEMDDQVFAAVAANPGITAEKLKPLVQLGYASLVKSLQRQEDRIECREVKRGRTIAKEYYLLPHAEAVAEAQHVALGLGTEAVH